MKEIRRIQVTGGSTYIVSLPKKWVLKYGLKRGDPVVLLYDGNKLVITPEEVEEEAVVEYRISRDNEVNEIIRQVISYYLAGYDVIRVLFGEPWEDLRVTIKKIIRKKMIGFEVTSEGPDYIEIRSLMKHGELPLSAAIRRLFELTNLILNNVILVMRDFDKHGAENIIIQDDDVDRLYLYIVRTIRYRISHVGFHVEEVIEPYEYVIYNMIVKALERIADHAVRIAHMIKIMSNRPPTVIYENMMNLLWMAAETFLCAKDAFYRKDVHMANTVINSVKKIVARETELVRSLERIKQPIHMAILCRITMESIRRISEYAADIGEMIVDLLTTPPKPG